MKEDELREQLVILNKELKACQEAIENEVRLLGILGVDIEKIVMKLKKHELSIRAYRGESDE